MTKLSCLPRAAVVALALASAFAPAVATAHPPIIIEAASFGSGDSFTRMVSYRDLNLASDDGRAALASRVKTAALDGCNDLYSRQPLQQTLNERMRCVRQSIAAAMPQVERAIALAQAGHSGAQVAVVIKR